MLLQAKKPDSLAGVSNPGDTAELPPPNRSIAFAVGPMAYALHKLAIGRKPRELDLSRFIDSNDDQANLIDWIKKYGDRIPELRDMQSLASFDWRALNEYLASMGFVPQFTEFNANKVGIAATVCAALKWLAAGTCCTIDRQVDGRVVVYPAFRLRNPYCYREELWYGAGPFTDRIVLRTAHGCLVYLAMLPEGMDGPRNGAELLKLATQLVDAGGRPQEDLAGIVVPMISFEAAHEVDWLRGLVVRTFDVRVARLAQARQEVRLYLNESGVEVDKAFAGADVFDLPVAARSYQVDQPFVLAVVDDKTPTVVCYFHPDDSWQAPPRGLIG